MHRATSIFYWVIVLGLFGTSAVFAYRVHRHRSRTRPAPNPQCLRPGDVVTVTRVVDGDEMFVSKLGCSALVRLLGVKTFDPVKAERELQVYAREAIATLRRLEGTRVTLAPGGFTVDTAQRVVATMTQDTRDVGLSLVSEGVAFVYRKYPFPQLQNYVLAEAEARARREGLWSSTKAAARVTALQAAWARERTP